MTVRILVGAPTESLIGTETGGAYLFEFDQVNWNLVHRFEPSDPTDYHWFGQDLDLDGPTVVIGAHGDQHAGRESGAAYIFVEDDLGWFEHAKLTCL